MGTGGKQANGGLAVGLSMGGKVEKGRRTDRRIFDFKQERGKT